MQTPEQIAAEEARAVLYRVQQIRRVQFQTGLWNALAGSPVARARLMAAWQPVIAYLAERELAPSDDAAEVDPLGISDTVNVGR